MGYQTIEFEGSLITPEILDQIYKGSAPYQKPSDFHLGEKERVVDEISSCWADVRAQWSIFQRHLAKLSDDDPGTEITRRHWVIPLLQLLNFEDVTYMKTAAREGGRTYAISHRRGAGENNLPIHIEGCRVDLDLRRESGGPRISAQGLVQEYINRTEHVWGIVTNGYQFRVLRDSTRLSKATYLQFDLEAMMKGDHFAEFQLFWRLAHSSRWPKDIENSRDCILEKYYNEGQAAGGRVREELRSGVKNALNFLGTALLRHPGNSRLQQAYRSGELDPENFYRQLLHLVYRFLFLMVAEERKLAGPDPRAQVRFSNIYLQYYSISRLRARIMKPLYERDRSSDLWDGVQQSFLLYQDADFGKILGIAPLAGDLFGSSAIPDLQNTAIYNVDFLKGFAHLSHFKDKQSGVVRPVNYGYLDVEELGSVYEGLLDYQPVIHEEAGQLIFSLDFGTGRKLTGSYYTHPDLVRELIASSLEPVIKERLKAIDTKKARRESLLSIKVCDPACGSGHFLLAAARRLGRELASIDSGEEHPTPEQQRRAVREVIRRCVYGVDFNPLAVDLCKVALWVEGHERNLPLSFLDHRIRCGNSLVGLDTVERLRSGIPDDAFKPVTSDDKDAASKIKKQNKEEREKISKSQPMLAEPATDKTGIGKLKADLQVYAGLADKIDPVEDEAVVNIECKEQKFAKLRDSQEWYQDATAADMWAAAFTHPCWMPMTPPYPPTVS